MKNWGSAVLCGVVGMVGIGAALRGAPAKLDNDVLKYEEPRSLSGAIYPLNPSDTNQLFKFKREVARADSILKVQRDFTEPDGKLAAREQLVYDKSNLVLYELNETQTGGVGSATIHRSGDNLGRIEFKYSSEPGARPKVRTEALRDNTLTADMVGVFLQTHWEALQRGETVRCRYMVVTRTETVGFNFVKDSESTRQGRDVVIVRMEASNPFAARLVQPLFFAMEKASPHRVLQYSGRTTPKKRVDGKWKDMDALTVFDWEAAR